MNPICPSCGSDNIQTNSIGDELLCKNGHILGIYDKSKDRTIPKWIYQ